MGVQISKKWLSKLPVTEWRLGFRPKEKAAKTSNSRSYLFVCVFVGSCVVICCVVFCGVLYCGVLCCVVFYYWLVLFVLCCVVLRYVAFTCLVLYHSHSISCFPPF